MTWNLVSIWTKLSSIRDMKSYEISIRVHATYFTGSQLIIPFLIILILDDLSLIIPHILSHKCQKYIRYYFFAESVLLIVLSCPSVRFSFYYFMYTRGSTILG